MADLELIIYEEDNETPYFAVGTAVAHANPYLHIPDAYAESEVDLLNGTSRIGRINVRIIDPQTGATQVDRFLTALLGNASGYSELNGRRALLKQVPSDVVVQDGICAGVILSESFAGFNLALEDFRARGVRTRVFTWTNTPTVFPRGVFEGYGPIPATTPIRAQYDVLTSPSRSYFFPVDQALREIPAQLVLTPAMLDAGTARGGTPLSYWLTFPNIEIGWRTVGSSTWNWLRNLLVEKSGGGRPNLFSPLPGVSIRKADGTRVAADVVNNVWAGAHTDGQTRPTDGQIVEMLVRYAGPPTKQYPLHYEGSAGDLLKDVLDGEYSTEPDGTPVPPRIPYDADRFVGASALPELQVPVRVRITEPEEDLREWFEKACKALGIAPALNASGEIAPVGQRLPDASVTLPEINDTNAVAIPGWEHPISNAVTQVEITYPRDYRVYEEQDPGGSASAGDGIASVDVPISVRPQDTDPASVIQEVMGVHPLQIDGFLFRAVGNALGLPVSGDVTDETGAQIAYMRGHEAIDRFAFGGQSSFVLTEEPVEEGVWVIDGRSWVPNYSTGERGRNHLCQVISVKRLNPNWREVRLLDAAPYANPIGQPTLGSVGGDANGVVSVPITAAPAGGEARVDYAIATTVPATGSPLWTFLGRTAVVPSTLQSPPLHAGSVVWIRSRGEQVGRRPSAWTTPVSITLANTARVSSGAVVINASGRAAVNWEVNAATNGVRIFYAVHRPGIRPDFTTSIDRDSDLGTASLPVTARAGEQISVEIEAWTGWTGSAVSGTAGPRLEAASVRPADATSTQVLDIIYLGSSNGERDYRVIAGALVDLVDIHWKLFTDPLPTDWKDQLLEEANYQTTVGDQGEFEATDPPQGQLLRGVGLARVLENGEYVVQPQGFYFGAEGTEPVIIPQDPIFDESTDGSTSAVSLSIEDPRGVVSGVDAFYTELGVTTGPFALLLAGAVFSTSFQLHPDHAVYVQLRINRNDGGDPLWLGPYSADTDKIPKEPVVREQDRTGDQALIYVDGADSDTATQWRRLVTAGVPGAETAIAARGVDGRYGSFTVTADPDDPLQYRIYGKNSDGVIGLYRDFWVAPYEEFAEITDVEAAVDALENTVNTTFRDSVISEADAIALAEHIRQLEIEKSDVDQEFATLDANPDLTGTADSNLGSAKSAFDSAHSSLISAITSAIADNVISSGELATVNGAFTTYEGALATYRQRMAEAFDAIKNRGVGAAYKPAARLSLVMTSDTNAEATLSITDSLIRIVAGSLKFGKKEGQGSDTGLITSWDSTTGTAGTDANLTRVENIAVIEGVESKFRWDLLYVDQDGNQKPMGDTVSVSNLKGVRKTIHIPFAMFQPRDPGTRPIQTNLDAPTQLPSNRGPAANSGGFAFWDYAPLVLPPGVAIREAYAHGYRASTSEYFEWFIYRIAFNSAPAMITVSGAVHSTTGWQQVDLGAINEVVPIDTFYHIMIGLDEPSARETCTHRGAEIKYDVDAHIKTY